jgi:hypothetical protein
MKHVALVPGKQVKNGHASRANFECCENGTKAKFIRAHSSVRRHCAAVGKALKIGPNIPRFRHFFSTPARHVQGTEYAFHALANQKALLVKLGRLF